MGWFCSGAPLVPSCHHILPRALVLSFDVDNCNSSASVPISVSLFFFVSMIDLFVFIGLRGHGVLVGDFGFFFASFFFTLSPLFGVRDSLRLTTHSGSAAAALKQWTI